MQWFWIYMNAMMLLQQSITISIPAREETSVSATSFYEHIRSADWKERDSIAVSEMLSGNIPEFYRRFVPVTVVLGNAAQDSILEATYYVAPDYLCIGSDQDWARIPLTPMAAQVIADSFHCFLPTRKMVDDIYEAAEVKLRPMPLLAYRDSSLTFWHHHLIIEGQRRGRKGLIAGIKKDVILTSRILAASRPNRVAIYGWHHLDGSPIQPPYTGHVKYYVDYSHGIRLVYRKININGTWMDYTEILRDETLRRLLCDEKVCDFERYSTKAF